MKNRGTVFLKDPDSEFLYFLFAGFLFRSEALFGLFCGFTVAGQEGVDKFISNLIVTARYRVFDFFIPVDNGILHSFITLRYLFSTVS